MLSSDPNLPMFNRAAQGRYNPGSTFKMVTALAALRHGTIGRYSPVDDVGKYDRYETYQPVCWYYTETGRGHGVLDVVQALERSCNYFFIYVGDRVNGGGESGAEALAQMARELGLGQSTGLEIPESAGVLATPAYKREVLNDGWWRADTLMTSFGQGHNLFTPVQLANYAATIANGGTLHSLTLLRRIKSADMSELLYSHEPEVRSVIPETEYIRIIQEGMRAVAGSRYGTAYREFGDYPIRIAAKTGTVQSETSEINNGVFVCYAPATNPEIAISIVIEKGGSGSAIMGIAKTILDYYFKSETTVLSAPYGELIP
jgi:penicillin-binding protein 2